MFELFQHSPLLPQVFVGEAEESRTGHAVKGRRPADGRVGLSLRTPAQGASNTTAMVAFRPLEVFPKKVQENPRDGAADEPDKRDHGEEERRLRPAEREDKGAGLEPDGAIEDSRRPSPPPLPPPPPLPEHVGEVSQDEQEGTRPLSSITAAPESSQSRRRRCR